MKSIFLLPVIYSQLSNEIIDNFAEETDLFSSPIEKDRPEGSWEAIKSAPFVDNESDDETDDGEAIESLQTSDLRSFDTVGNILVYKLCPPGHDQNPAYCEEGFPKKNGKIKPYSHWISTMLNRHGCNCFPETNDQGKLIPVVNGKGKDDMDIACADLARSITCIEDMVESGNYFKVTNIRHYFE